MRAAIDQMIESDVSVTPTASSHQIWNEVRVRLWLWIEENGDQKVSLRFWLIRASFKIKDLHPVFSLLLGPRPDHSAP